MGRRKGGDGRRGRREGGEPGREGSAGRPREAAPGSPAAAPPTAAAAGALLPAVRGVSRIRGLLILVLVALLGWGLASLGSGRPGFDAAWIEGPAGETVIAIVDRLASFSGEREVRLVLAKAAADLDPFRGVLGLPDGARRVLPPSWPTTLVGRDGTLVRHPLWIPAGEASLLLRCRDFGEARRRLAGIDPVLGAWLGVEPAAPGAAPPPPPAAPPTPAAPPAAAPQPAPGATPGGP